MLDLPRDASCIGRGIEANSDEVFHVNWCGTQHDSRHDGGRRSYRGRVALVVTTMRGMVPQFIVAIDCASKPAGLEGLSWESPG